MAKLFISYARDASVGEALAVEAQQQLQAAGFEVFRDAIGIGGGDHWVMELEKNLLASQAVVLILSEKVRGSRWVHSEVDLAEAEGIPVVPVFAEVVRLPLWLRHLQVLDFSGEQNWGELVADLWEKINEHDSEPSSSPACPEATFQEKRSRQRGQGVKADWAAESGTDEFGHFSDLAVGDLVQRFRFIDYADGSFWLADTVCTQALWLAVMGDNPAEFSDNLQKPVECVSWNQAQRFLEALNGHCPDLQARLPTQREWQFACRGYSKTPYLNFTQEQVNFNGQGTVLVKSLRASTHGLYEMHGNVWEWCEDDTDQWGDLKVLCGGSWLESADGVHADATTAFRTTFRQYMIGFRIAV